MGRLASVLIRDCIPMTTSHALITAAVLLPILAHPFLPTIVRGRPTITVLRRSAWLALWIYHIPLMAETYTNKGSSAPSPDQLPGAPWGAIPILPLTTGLNLVSVSVGLAGEFVAMPVPRSPRGMEDLVPGDMIVSIASAHFFICDGLIPVVEALTLLERKWADLLTFVLYVPVIAWSHYWRAPLCSFVKRDVSWWVWLRTANADNPFEPTWSRLLMHIVEFAAVVLPAFALWSEMNSRLLV